MAKKKKIRKKIGESVKKIRILRCIWAYLTTVFFVYNSIHLLVNNEFIAFGIVLTLAIGYCIFVTLMIKKQNQDKKTATDSKEAKFYRFLSRVFGLAICFTTIYITGYASVSSVVKVLNILWLVVTITLDVVLFVAKSAAKKALSLVMKNG